MIEIQLDNFKKMVVEQKGVVFLAVETDWCEPCKKMAEITDKLKEFFSEKQITFYSLNLDKNPAFTAYYRMKGLPTVIIFENGIMKQTIMGVKSVDEYQKVLEDLFSGKQKQVDSHKVKVFSTPTCPYCHMVKAYLKQKNVAYEDIDVSQDRTKATEMVNRSGEMGVPQLWIDNEVVVGFDQSKINKLLGL